MLFLKPPRPQKNNHWEIKQVINLRWVVKSIFAEERFENAELRILNLDSRAHSINYFGRKNSEWMLQLG
jgi:hypothetical protein